MLLSFSLFVQIFKNPISFLIELISTFYKKFCNIHKVIKVTYDVKIYPDKIILSCLVFFVISHLIYFKRCFHGYKNFCCFFFKIKIYKLNSTKYMLTLCSFLFNIINNNVY